MDSNQGNKNIFDELLKEWKSIVTKISSVKLVRPSDQKRLEKLEKYANDLPDLEILMNSIMELKNKTLHQYSLLKETRIQNYKKHESEFIRNLKENEEEIKEFNEGWRCGPLEIRNNQSSQIQILYNSEVIIKWTDIDCKEDIFKAYKEAYELLNSFIIDKKIIIDLFKNTYDKVIYFNKEKNSSSILITDFYKELRVELLGLEIRKKPVANVKNYLAFPKWAFLYNIDLYRKMGKEIPYDKKLIFETGTQQEVSKNLGMILNGLTPNDDYKMMCYISTFRR